VGTSDDRVMMTPFHQLVDVALRCNPHPVESEAGSEATGISFQDFAAIAAQAERSPVLSTIALPSVGDQSSSSDEIQPLVDNDSREAADTLMMVGNIADATASDRPRRASRSNVKGSSPSSKVPGAKNKKAKKTAETASEKVKKEPVSNAKVASEPKVPKPAHNLKGPIDGGIDGVTMAPQALNYAEMAYVALERHSGPTRVGHIFREWQRIWPFYAAMTDFDQIKSLNNSIRHNMSLKK
jgi:hypothetical protein